MVARPKPPLPRSASTSATEVDELDLEFAAGPPSDDGRNPVDALLGDEEYDDQTQVEAQTVQRPVPSADPLAALDRVLADAPRAGGQPLPRWQTSDSVPDDERRPALALADALEPVSDPQEVDGILDSLEAEAQRELAESEWKEEPTKIARTVSSVPPSIAPSAPPGSTPAARRSSAPPPAIPPAPAVPELKPSVPPDQPQASPADADVLQPRTRRAPWLISGLLLGALGGAGGLTVAQQQGVAPALTSDAAAVGSNGPASSSASTSPPAAEQTTLEKAAGGDASALEALKKRSDLSIDEAVALSKGTGAQRSAELSRLEKRLQADPKVVHDPGVQKSLLAFTHDPNTWAEALGVIARTDGTFGPDALYHIWVDTPGRTPATELAQRLVMTKAVQKKASGALSVALKLRSAEDCAARKALLPEAKKVADTRAVRVLAKFQLRAGCGPKKIHDCNPCLRKTLALAEATNAARGRPAPRFK